ncbi:MAG: hypothetical protein ACPL4K_06840 [Candidatus Margulisiibacteriota bacterium]
MKKIIGVILVVVFLVGLSPMLLAQIEVKKEELRKVEAYIKSLDQKINQAQAAKQTKKVKELKILREEQIKRAQALQAEIIKLQTGKPSASKLKSEKAGFLAGAGYGGGAGILSVGYALPLGGVDLNFDAGYGIGNKYSILVADISSVFSFAENYAGLALGVANYSDKVTDIPGLSGIIDKGAKVGFAVFAGRSLGMINVQAGYSTALGLTVGAKVKF